MKILIGYSACGLTRQAFRDRGHDAWTCDLLPARDGSPFHLQCDVWEVARDRWDMAIFHPMCTYLTCSAAWAFNEPNFERYPGTGYHQKLAEGTLTGKARQEARREAVENFVALMDLPYPKACENPGQSFLARYYRSPDQIIHPYEFGDDASKRTGLWLDRLPKLKPTRHIAPRLVCCGHVLPAGSGDTDCPICDGKNRALPRWANQTNSGQNKLTPGKDRWLERSKTYGGIADAFGAQWSRQLCEGGSK